MAQAGGARPGLGRRHRPVVIFDLVAGAVGLAPPFDRGDERFDAVAVELGARALAELLEGGLLREGTPVGAGRRHRVECVGDVDDRRLDERAALDRGGRRLGRGVAGDGSEEVDATQQLH